ncbi:MAG: hypothetical protein WAL56_18255 [Candidatus Sulfotelmatobacter sp.]
MKAKKASADRESFRLSPQPPTPTASAAEGQSTRKPWKKKSPVEVMLDQIDRLRGDVDRKEEELKQAKRQMQKLEEARKLLESD